MMNAPRGPHHVSPRQPDSRARPTRPPRWSPSNRCRGSASGLHGATHHRGAGIRTEGILDFLEQLIDHSGLDWERLTAKLS